MKIFYKDAATKAPSDICEPLIDADAKDANRLVLLPDLASTAQSWNKMWLLMLGWRLTSIVTVLVIAPLAAFHEWSIASMAAIVTAAFSTVGIAQYGLRPQGKPEDVLEINEQLGVAALCGKIAAQVDAFIVGVSLAVLCSTGCVRVPLLPAACTTTEVLHSVVMVAFFTCHGILSYVIATRADALMPKLEFVESPASMV